MAKTPTPTPEGKAPKKGKTNGYKSDTLHRKREAKRDAAEARTDRYRALSPKDRLKLAQSRRGESKREVARLEALIAAQKEDRKKPEAKSTESTERRPAKKPYQKPKKS